MVMEQVELLRAACCIAALDGDVSEKERRAIGQLAEKAGVGRASMEAMIDMAMSDSDFYEEQLEYVRKDPASALRLLVKVAKVDGEATLEERVILRHFGEKMGMGDGEIDGVLG